MSANAAAPLLGRLEPNLGEADYRVCQKRETRRCRPPVAGALRQTARALTADVLVVDFDGTLIRSDLPFEAILGGLRQELDPAACRSDESARRTCRAEEAIGRSQGRDVQR